MYKYVTLPNEKFGVVTPDPKYLLDIIVPVIYVLRKRNYDFNGTTIIICIRINLSFRQNVAI